MANPSEKQDNHYPWAEGSEAAEMECRGERGDGEGGHFKEAER